MSLIQAAIVCHDDAFYLSSVIGALGEIPVTVFVSESSWGSAPAGNWQHTVEVAAKAGASVITGVWTDEESQRKAVLEWAKSEGIQFLIVPDSDEILSAELLLSLKKIAAVDLADVVYCSMDTYWKSPEYVIRPRERLMPVIMLKPAEIRYEFIREFIGSRPLAITHEHGVLHHLSYSGPDSRVRRKVSSWSHKDEVVPNWLGDVWTKWDSDRTKQHLHPTRPEKYGFAERIKVPTELEHAWAEYLEAHGGRDPLHSDSDEVDSGQPWPKVSIVIPLYGGEEDIRLCLDSLSEIRDVVHEVIVVDDCSPDEAAAVAESFDFVKLLRNEVNSGFAKTCNYGASQSTGEVILFLNSDTIVPRVGFLRQIRSLMKSGSIAAVGPSSNAVGHFQRIPVTYTSIEHIDPFAEDLALSGLDDFEADMLVGFCLAVRRTAWDEVGGFDERFAVGLFEDNDLCYKLRRAGYRLLVVPSAFVHHKGGASLVRHNEPTQELFLKNADLFHKKWQRDIETGFASHLSGRGPDSIRFDESRRPEKLIANLKSRVKEANISLCMIVRNEERVLADCLSSAKPFFNQIVVVDTGSNDATVEIAKSFGAEVYEIPWPDSFASARNESLSHATGDWICWLDADDTLPFSSGENIVGAVLWAPAQIGGLVLPVRFVNDDPEFGSSVDHVKVFRNNQGFQFEGRIHEQILPSLRGKGFDVTRIQAEVLHTGYDVSEEGQTRKRKRDEKLLKLDLEDRPDHPFVLFNLGMTAHYNGEHEDAIKWLEKSVSFAKSGESHVRKAYALWAVSVRELGDSQTALQIVEKGLAEVGDDPELLFHLGLLCTNLSRLEDAAVAYEKVLMTDRSSFFSSSDTGIFGFKTLHNLGNVYSQLNDPVRAKQNFLAAMQSNPRFLHSTFDLFRLSLSERDWGTAEECLTNVQRIEGISSNFVKMDQQYRDLRNSAHGQ